MEGCSISVSSFSFLIFLGVIALLHRALPARCSGGCLLLASLVYYATWAPKALPVLLLAAVIVYVGGRIVGGRVNAGKRARLALGISIAASFAPLFLCKYLGFFVSLFQRALHAVGVSATLTAPSLLVPIGISFFTLQGVSYLVDLYRKKLSPERNFFYVLLFLCFFPSVTSGPIARAGEMLPQFREKHTPTYAQVKHGCLRILLGLFMKLMIADRIAPWISMIYGDPVQYAGLPMWNAVFLYGMEIYADFAGYSHIALGAAELLGVKLPENFTLPYLSLSIREFWRRWHQSLSSWLRDYVYIPLGGSRCSKKRKYVNVLVTFACSGLWHGVGLNYIAWGLLHGIYQVLGDVLAPVREFLCRVLHLGEGSRLRTVLSTCWTFLLVDFAWILFRCSSLSNALAIVRGLCQRGTASFAGLVAEHFVNYVPGFVLLMILLVVFLIAECYKRYTGKSLYARWLSKGAVFQWVTLFLCVMLLLVCGVYGPSYDAQSFIYSNF